MYKIDDMVVYGEIGVCRVAAITVPEFAREMGNREYYELIPLYERGQFYAPVDNTSISLRPVISKEDAVALFSRANTIEFDIFTAVSTQKMTECYKRKLRTQSCEEFLRIIVSAVEKKRQAEANNKKFGQIDKKFKTKAEMLLYGELAVVLDIDREEVRSKMEEIINKRILG